MKEKEIVITDAWWDQLRRDGRIDLGEEVVIIHVPYLTDEDASDFAQALRFKRGITNS
jgi:hypothetical protein